MTDTTTPTTPSPGKPAAPTAAATPATRTPHPVLELLKQRYPALFGDTPQPLKRGIFQDLFAVLEPEQPEGLSKATLKQALAIHTRSLRYLQAVASGAPRLDLSGQVAEATTPEHRLHALLTVFARRRPRPQETPEQMQARLQRRIGQVFVDSGLSAEQFLARLQGQSPEDAAKTQAALADVAAQDARAEAVQQAFAASGAKSVAAFARMYAMHPKAVERQLARAQQLQHIRQTAPPSP